MFGFLKRKVRDIVAPADGQIVALESVDDEVFSQKMVDEAGLKKHMSTHLANYKIPKQIHVIDALPKNATGKVLKRVLKEKLREEV